jgi:PhnB protein
MAQAILPMSGVIAHLTVAGAAAASHFYIRAFGAIETFRLPAKDDPRLLYCRLCINGGVLMLSDDFPEYHGGVPTAPPPDRLSPVTLHLQVTDCDAVFRQAIACGATAITEPADMFWGDRYCQLRDPFGHRWSIAHTPPGGGAAA